MRHHSTSIVGPDIDGPTKDGMIAAMDDAARLVASWPQWKREVLRDSPPAQPSMKEAMARVDARAEKVVANIPLSQRAIISKDESPPAQPSVGENVMRAIHVASGWSGVELTQSLRDTLRPMALAVRREVLAEPFTDEDVKAADKAFMAFRGGGRTDWIRAALVAAARVRLEKAEGEQP